MTDYKELSERLTAEMKGQRVTFSRVVGTIESVEVEDGRAFVKLSSMTAPVPLAECWAYYTKEDIAAELAAKRQETKHEA